MGPYVTIIIFVSVSLLMWLLLRASRRKPVMTKEGNQLLRYSTGFSVVGYLLMVFATLFGVVLAFNMVMTLKQILIGEAIILVIIPLAVWLVLFILKSTVEFNDEEVVSHGLFRSARHMKWSQVTNVNYGRFSSALSLRSDVVKISVNMYLVGFPTFVEVMKSRLPLESYREAITTMQSSRR